MVSLSSIPVIVAVVAGPMVLSPGHFWAALGTPSLDSTIGTRGSTEGVGGMAHGASPPRSVPFR
eukprot:scaffold87059_cov60-Phaeocystis_antarctica.AAC.2